MIKTDGTIDPDYLDGRRRYINKYVQLPEIKKPTNLEWSKWKAFIFKNFLSKGYRVTKCPIQKNNSDNWEERNEILYLKNVQKSTAVMSTIGKYPSSLRNLLQEIEVYLQMSLSTCAIRLRQEM